MPAGNAGILLASPAAIGSAKARCEAHRQYGQCSQSGHALPCQPRQVPPWRKSPRLAGNLFHSANQSTPIDDINPLQPYRLRLEWRAAPHKSPNQSWEQGAAVNAFPPSRSVTNATTQGSANHRLRRIRHCFHPRLRAKSSSCLRARHPQHPCRHAATPLHTRCKGRIPESGGSILLPLRRSITPAQPSYPVFPGHAGRAGNSPRSTGHPIQPSVNAAPVGVPALAGLSVAGKRRKSLRNARRERGHLARIQP